MCCSLIGRDKSGTCRTGRKGSADPGHSGDDRAGLGSEGHREARPRGGPPAMKPTGTEHTAPGGAGRTHSMIRETCSRTGTLLSLKAVVMKQPKVSAAITLSEKANREFARDSTVFIVTAFPREPRLRHPYFRLRFPRPTSPSHPRTRCARPGSERRRPAPFPVPDGSAHAPTHWDTPTARPCTRQSATGARVGFCHGGPASSATRWFLGLWLGRRSRLLPVGLQLSL